jgi:hypothetical protein
MMRKQKLDEFESKVNLCTKRDAKKRTFCFGETFRNLRFLKSYDKKNVTVRDNNMGQANGKTVFQSHIAAAVFHGAVAASAAAFFVTSQKDKGMFALTQRVYDRLKWEVRSDHLKWLVVAFPALSMTNHIASAVQLGRRDNYEVYAGETNTFRWAEYGVSAGLMFWIIAQLSGTTDVPALFTVLMLNVSLQVCGYMVERTGDPLMGFTVMGWLLFVAVWVPIVWKFIDALAIARDSDDDDVDVPGAIYAIIFLQISLFTAFGVASVYFRKRREPKDIIHRELTYTTLSFVAKTLLTGLVVGGALNAGPQDETPVQPTPAPATE